MSLTSNQTHYIDLPSFSFHLHTLYTYNNSKTYRHLHWIPLPLLLHCCFPHSLLRAAPCDQRIHRNSLLRHLLTSVVCLENYLTCCSTAINFVSEYCHLWDWLSVTSSSNSHLQNSAITLGRLFLLLYRLALDLLHLQQRSYFYSSVLKVLNIPVAKHIIN